MAPKKPTAKKSVKIEATKHADKRVNIPTEDLRGFVPEKHQQTPPVEFPGLLYARDPSLDPQLVWKGKDAQDRQPLAVPNVPIYIQDKIHPQAIIEAAERYRDDPNREPQFTTMPETWLNQERWEAGPLPPRSGNQSASQSAWEADMRQFAMEPQAFPEIEGGVL